MVPPPINKKCIETMFQDIPRFSKDGKRLLKSKGSLECIKLAGELFYKAGTSGSLECLHDIATNDHPGLEWVIWPRGGWGTNTLPAIYIRNPYMEKDLAKAKEILKKEAAKTK